jgi:hypothetical protein
MISENVYGEDSSTSKKYTITLCETDEVAIDPHALLVLLKV